jgi:hypothetical protein
MRGWRVGVGKFAALSVAFLVAAASAANADPQYRAPADPQHSVLPPANAPPDSGAPAPAGSWYYDPYTHGSATCPEGGEDAEPKCNILIPPSYPTR